MLILKIVMVTLKRIGEGEATRDKVTRHELRHDRHTVSLPTDHVVFSPKYRGKVLDGEVAEAAEEIIRETCKKLDGVRIICGLRVAITVR